MINMCSYTSCLESDGIINLKINVIHVRKFFIDEIGSRFCVSFCQTGAEGTWMWAGCAWLKSPFQHLNIKEEKIIL